MCLTTRSSHPPDMDCGDSGQSPSEGSSESGAPANVNTASKHAVATCWGRPPLGARVRARGFASRPVSGPVLHSEPAGDLGTSPHRSSGVTFELHTDDALDSEDTHPVTQELRRCRAHSCCHRPLGGRDGISTDRANGPMIYDERAHTMQPLRIAYLHQYYATPKGTTSTRSYELSGYWQQCGHTVTVITGTTEHERRRRESHSGVQVHYCGMPYSQHFGTIARLASWAAYCTAATIYIARRRATIDVVYASSTPLSVLVPALMARALMGIPFVFEVRDVWPEVPIALGRLNSRLAQHVSRFVATLGYRLAGRIVALSPDMSRLIVENYEVPSGKVSVAPNGTHVASRRRTAASSVTGSHVRGMRTVIYTGTLGQVNDPEFIIRLCAAVRALDPTIHFAIFGDGSESSKCQELAAQLGVLNHGLTMHARVAKAVVLEHVAAADLSLSTTADISMLWANSANKVFESLGSGTPVAINHGGWLADFLEAEAVGVVLDREDMSRAAQQLVSYLNDGPATTEGMSDHCRHIAATHFDWQIIGGDTLAAIEASVFGSGP